MHYSYIGVIALLVGTTVADHFEDDVKICNRRSHASRKSTPSKLSVIIDTDIGAYPDDPAAISVMHGLADRAQANILAVVGSTRYEGIAMAIDVLNTFFGRPNIPVGVTKDPKAYSDPQGSQKWTEYVRSKFEYKIKQNSEAEDAVLVYRKVLAEADNQSVTIIQLGHFTNLANLLNSNADNISHLSGLELTTQKVREVITMAGHYPTGQSWNIAKDVPSAVEFEKRWPSPVTYIVSEIGRYVTCGEAYNGKEKQMMNQNPIAASTYFGYQLHYNYEGCYDAVASIVAGHLVDGLYCKIKADIEIESNGTNQWNQNTPSGKQRVLFEINKSHTDKEVSKAINRFLPIKPKFIDQPINLWEIIFEPKISINNL